MSLLEVAFYLQITGRAAKYTHEVNEYAQKLFYFVIKRLVLEGKYNIDLG